MFDCQALIKCNDNNKIDRIRPFSKCGNGQLKVMAFSVDCVVTLNCNKLLSRSAKISSWPYTGGHCLTLNSLMPTLAAWGATRLMPLEYARDLVHNVPCVSPTSSQTRPQSPQLVSDITNPVPNIATSSSAICHLISRIANSSQVSQTRP